MPKDQMVLFVDMLGFAALTESSGDLDEQSLEWTLGMSPESLSSGGMERFLSRDKTSALVVAFRRFHDIVERANKGRIVDKPITYLSFSDSVCLVTVSKFQVFKLACHVMRQLILARLPARMGMGRGDFFPVRFGADWRVGDVGSSARAQFLGTGLVRAYAAGERSGVPGMRIILHESAICAAKGGWLGATPHLEVTTESCVVPPVELNYLHDQTPEAVVAIVNAVLEMRKNAPKLALHHYDETLDAMRLMRRDLNLPKSV